MLLRVVEEYLKSRQLSLELARFVVLKMCHKLSPSETVAKRERLNILAKKLVLLFPRCQKSWASRSGELRLHPGDISRPAQLFIQHKSHRGVLMKCDHSREGVRFNYIP
jgi:hypothetical protein